MSDHLPLRVRPLLAVAAYKRAMLADPCAYCGAPSDLLDHIVPRSRGGANEWVNFAGVCDGCNRAKHSKSLLGFLGNELNRPYVEATIADAKEILAMWRAV